MDLLRELRVLEEDEDEDEEGTDRGGTEAVYEGQHAGLPIDVKGVILDMA